MIGRAGYQILNFNNATLSTTPTTVKDAFKKAKSGLPILLKGIKVGEKMMTAFSYDSNVSSSTDAKLPIFVVGGDSVVIGQIIITSDDGVTIAFNNE